MNDLESERCCSIVQTMSTQSARHCEASGRLQRLVRTVVQELVDLA
jgi:hypothetical protein